MKMIHITEYFVRNFSGNKLHYTDLYVSMDNIAGIDAHCSSLPEIYFKRPIGDIKCVEVTQDFFENKLKPKFSYFS